MAPEVQHMAEVARSYCQLVEAVSDANGSWLDHVARLLPRIHASVAALGEHSAFMEHTLDADLDARFELFSHLRELLGHRDGYWMEFDRRDDRQCMSGSLADDLTDIYCELKHGLRVLESHEDGAEKARETWLRGYSAHWGQHLLDAERHLYSLQVRGALAS